MTKIRLEHAEVAVVDAFHFELVTHVWPTGLATRLGISRMQAIQLMAELAEALNDTDDSIERITEAAIHEVCAPVRHDPDAL